jgi:hypothetical protein
MTKKFLPHHKIERPFLEAVYINNLDILTVTTKFETRKHNQIISKFGVICFFFNFIILL